ncbi:MAG: hypothetical protein WC661_22275 [Opitutaceae bacterium]|jgi:hypothetical protein
MNVKSRKFIVVSIGNLNGCAYDERSLPFLTMLVDSHVPDHRVITNRGIIVYFRTSKRKFKRVRSLVVETGALRARDTRFTELTVGVAEGELSGEFDWFGRVKTYGYLGLFGGANLEAVRSETTPGACKATLLKIAQRLEIQAA